MTNYHPDPQRAYDAHCADGYVVPDDETGPQEATGATESDVPRVQAHGDGAGLREAVEALADKWQADLDGTGGSVAILSPGARYCWGVAVRELRAALASIKGQPS